jgi:hypothetical protein
MLHTYGSNVITLHCLATNRFLVFPSKYTELKNDEAKKFVGPNKIYIFSAVYYCSLLSERSAVLKKQYMSTGASCKVALTLDR